MRPIVRTAAIVVLALAPANWASAEAGIDDLLPLIPGSANALVIVRARQLLDSPRGQKENWRAKRAADFLAGSIGVPPSVDVIVRGAHITPAQPTGTWSVGLIHRPPQLNIDVIARHEQGQQEVIDGKPCVLARRGYFAELTPGVLGVMSADASRQDFARWLRASASGGASGLSTYLLSAAAADNSAQILLAIDLRDMPDPLLLGERLASNPALKGRTSDQAALLKLIMSVQGCRLAIRVTDATTASLTFDFADDVMPQAVFLKPVVIEMLEDLGAVLDELRDAKVTSSGKSVALDFSLTDQGLRRIMSLVPMPLVNRPASAGAGAKGAAADVAASRDYYRQVSRLLTDLQRLNRSAREYQKTALWHDNYAKRIAELPVVGVDPELLDYGADVVQKLRLLAASLRGTTIDLETIQTQAKYQVNVSPFYGPAGSFRGTAGYVPAPWEVSTNLSEVRSQQAEAAARGASQREQIWQILENETIRIRNRMAEKYSVDFNRSAK